MLYRSEKDFLCRGNMSPWQMHRVAKEGKRTKQLGRHYSHPGGAEWEEKTDAMSLFKAKPKDLTFFLKLK